MCFFRRKKKKRLAEEEQKRQEQAAKKTVKPVQEPAPKVEQTSKVNNVKKTSPKVETKVSKEEEKEDTRKNVKYHVSQNKDDKSKFFKQWRVRKQGSQKTIKYFPTQLEAIEYAEHLAEQSDTKIVIHKVDGSIRKQDYTKK